MDSNMPTSRNIVMAKDIVTFLNLNISQTDALRKNTCQ
jgi:hypothetical protein